MHFTINHVRGRRKNKACEIKVSICVHVYNVALENLERRQRNQQDWKANISSIKKYVNLKI